MLGDVGQPERIHRLSHELTFHQIVMYGRPRTLVLPGGLAFPEHAPPPLRGTDPPRGPVTHRLTSRAGFICEETMPELRVINVGGMERVRAIRLRKLSLSDGLFEPAVVGLA